MISEEASDARMLLIYTRVEYVSINNGQVLLHPKKVSSRGVK